MAVLFFDSSGLVKRYVAETGTAWVQSITAASARNDRFIAQITGAEMVSAVVRRLRRGDLSLADAETAQAEIAADFAQHFFLLEVSLPRIQEAMLLSQRHGLRGYDAVQLAAVLFLRDQCRLTGLSDPLLIAADKELCLAAQAEGLLVDNPNTH